MLQHRFTSWLLFPVYVWQGLALRRRIERLLPHPSVAIEGIIHGVQPHIRLLVVGDSTVASVGMERTEDAMAWNIANALHEATGRSVAWRAAGANSATTGHLRDYIIPHVEERDWTHVVVSAGTNDMKNFHATSTFKRDFGTLIYALKTRFPDARIVWASIPDMRKFPALPKGLARVLAARASLINAVGRQLCNERGAVFAAPIPINGADGFARDGFHPGPTGYRLWGHHLVGALLQNDETASDDSTSRVTQFPGSRKSA